MVNNTKTVMVKKDAEVEDITTSTIKIPTKAWAEFEIIIQRKNVLLPKERKKEKLNKSIVISDFIKSYVRKYESFLDRPDPLPDK